MLFKCEQLSLLSILSNVGCFARCSGSNQNASQVPVSNANVNSALLLWVEKNIIGFCTFVLGMCFQYIHSDRALVMLSITLLFIGYVLHNKVSAQSRFCTYRAMNDVKHSGIVQLCLRVLDFVHIVPSIVKGLCDF